MVKVFHMLKTAEEAKQLLSKGLSSMITDGLRNISDASGYISSEDLYSAKDVPPFDRSEVDGYALNHRSISGADEDNPVELEITREIEIGKRSDVEVKEGEAAYISTGAMIPRGADSVIMVEYTSRSGRKVSIFRSVSPGENVAHAGSDFFVGEYLTRRGNKISPEEVALLASSGISRVKVKNRIRVGIISVGDELTDPGKPLKMGKIFDSNSYYFKSTLDRTGLTQCELLGTLPDDRREMENFVRDKTGRFDLLISSGSTSAGFHDMLYGVIEELGGKMLFHGLSIKPGKPTFAAAFEKCIFLGMPGFPLSAGAVLRYIVVPSLKSTFGQQEDAIKSISLPFRINAERGKSHILPAIIGRSGRAYPIFGESGSISRLAYADGFIILKPSKNYYEKDERVPFFPLERGKREILFIGSNDPLMERILFESVRFPTIINAGSWGGFEAARIGEADVSGVHLLKNGKYNTFLLKEDKGRNLVLVRGFSRTQGLVSRNGIHSFLQVRDLNLIFVNRNKGSGTRDLIEIEMEKEFGPDFERDRIRGYRWEAKSHAAVANAVKQKRADAGVSIQFYAKKLNLKFHKIRDENYDLLLQRSFYESKVGGRLIERLKDSREYSQEFPGYNIPENVGDLIYE